MNSKGFTMIELLISVSIFALIIGGLTLALSQQQKQYNITQEAVDLDQTARATLDYIATEIRNAVSRQGKSFSLNFVNGGSTAASPCTTNTPDAGTEDSPPECLTIFTWDITKGQFVDPVTKENNLPSIAGITEIVSKGPPLVLNLPPNWFDGNNLIGETQQVVDANLGFRSRINLCNPANSAICGTNPDKCTECAAIIRASINGTTKQATIADSAGSILTQNFQDSPYTSLDDFVTNAFVPGISSQVSEMTIVQSKAFRVNTVNRQLEMSQNGGPFQPIAGGTDAPGIVDLQLVLNLQTRNGGITKGDLVNTLPQIWNKQIGSKYAIPDKADFKQVIECLERWVVDRVRNWESLPSARRDDKAFVFDIESCLCNWQKGGCLNGS